MPACVLLYAMRRTDRTNTKKYIQSYRRNRLSPTNTNPSASADMDTEGGVGVGVGVGRSGMNNSNRSGSSSVHSGWLATLFLRSNTEPGHSLVGFDDSDDSDDSDDDAFGLIGGSGAGLMLDDPDMPDHVVSPLLRATSHHSHAADDSPPDSSGDDPMGLSSNGNNINDSLSTGVKPLRPQQEPLDFYQGAPNNHGLYRYT